MSDQEKKQKNDAKAQAMLKTLANTEVEKDQVVSMVGNLIGMLGTMGGASPIVPRTNRPAAKQVSKETTAKIRHLTEVLENAAENKSIESLQNDDQFMYWVKKEGCKQKTFDEEMELVRQTIDLAGEHKAFDLGIYAAEKGITMARIHRRNDVELQSELYWVKAELYAASDKMPDALKTLKQCVALADPEASEDSEAFRELAKQLEVSRAAAK